MLPSFSFIEAYLTAWHCKPCIGVHDGTCKTRQKIMSVPIEKFFIIETHAHIFSYNRLPYVVDDRR